MQQDTIVRSRARRMLPLAATGVVAVVASLYLRAVDPNVPGHYPGCPSQMLLGVDCPGCGGLRGTHDLLHGDVTGMVDNNILLVVAVPAAVVAFVVWAYRVWTGRRAQVDLVALQRSTRIWIVALVVVLAFGVVRNFVPFLGAGPG